MRQETAYQNLDTLFNPESVALIGASSSITKWGYIILLNILKGNYKGRLYPINPKTDSILGYRCHKRIENVPEIVDLAIITTPAQTVPSLVKECGVKGVPNIVVITADFSETGPEGAKLEEEVVSIAKEYSIRIVGPNTMGIFSSSTSLHALMPMVMPLHGNVSMFSQSGNVGVQMLDYGQNENVGFEKFVSSGNEADLNEEAYLSYFANDERTKVIIGYIEGINPNSTLISTAKEASKKKPVIIMKGGRTTVGSQAAASHTGSLAGSNRIFQAAFKQAGIIRAASGQELIDCAKAFSHYPLPKGNRIGIVTRGGGWGVLSADACEENGLRIAPLPENLIKKMDQILPKYWNRSNPIDLVASIGFDPLPDCLKMLVEWDGVDAILALGAGFRSFSYQYSKEVKEPKELVETLQFLEQVFDEDSGRPDEVLQLVGELVKKSGKPIISVTIGSDSSHKSYLERYDVVSYPTPERAVRVLKHMYNYQTFLKENR